VARIRYRYFPGCTLKTQAQIMEQTALVSAEALGIQLEELPRWQCCGAVFPLYEDEAISLLSPVRTLAAAGGEPLVSLCAACHHVLKRVQEAVRRNKEVREKVTDFLQVDYGGEGRVLHFLELLRDDYGFSRLAAEVRRPLAGQKLAPYYGCLLLRPGGVMQFDDPENPETMEEFLAALGADPVSTAYRTECCGAYLSVTRSDVAASTAGRIVEAAAKAGAEALVAACPLCRYNLENSVGSGGPRLPVYYFTELLAEALGVAPGEEVKPG
jgi:heterodisulfide reductase subunit B